MTVTESDVSDVLKNLQEVLRHKKNWQLKPSLHSMHWNKIRKLEAEGGAYAHLLKMALDGTHLQNLLQQAEKGEIPE